MIVWRVVLHVLAGGWIDLGNDDWARGCLKSVGCRSALRKMPNRSVAEGVLLQVTLPNGATGL